jgi:thiamine biosynthesis lipoprotein
MFDTTVHRDSVTDDCTISIQRWRTELSVTVRGIPAPGVAAVLRDEVGRMETSISRFREDSELSDVNRRSGEWVPVSWYFVSVLNAALVAAEETGGLVNPCLATAVDAAGYHHWRGGPIDSGPGPMRMPPRREPPPLLHAWRTIAIRDAGSHAQVRIPRGVALDLGAVAKGWLADRVATLVVDRFGVDTVADMGGDLRAIATREPWLIDVSPMGSDHPTHELSVWDAGIATSSVGRRAWSNPDGTRAHHIIDPRTGESAMTPWMSCSVVAAGAEGANAMSTAALVLGSHAPRWLRARNTAAWLVADHAEHRTDWWPDLVTPAGLPA